MKEHGDRTNRSPIHFSLQFFVRTIAERWGGCPLATTQIDGVGLVCSEGHRLKLRAFM